MDVEISHFSYNSKHHDKCTFVLKLIRLSTVSNLFPLKVVQCQLCELRETGKLDWDLHVTKRIKFF